MDKQKHRLTNGILAAAILLSGITGCSSTVVGEYDYNDYHYKAPKRTFVTSNAKITERVSGNKATYTLSGNFYLPSPPDSEKKVVVIEALSYNEEYSLVEDLVIDPPCLLLGTVVLVGPLGAIVDKDWRAIYLSWLCPGISAGDASYASDCQPIFSRKNHTEIVSNSDSNPLPVQKSAKKSDVGFRLLDERGRLHKQSDGKSSLDLDLRDLARKALKEGGDTFKVVARIGKPGDSISGGQTEFIFKHRALDYSPPYSTLTDRITADCKVDVWRGSSRESMSLAGTTPWEKEHSAFGNRLFKQYIQLRSKDLTSPVIEQPATTKDRSIHFVTKKMEVLFTCGVENALLKHGPTLEQMKVGGGFPVKLNQKTLIPSTGQYQSEPSEYWVQVLAEGYYSEPLKIDFSKTKQVNFIEKTIKETITSDPKGAEVLIGARPNLLNAVSKDSLFGSKTETTPYQGMAKALVAQHDGRQQQVRFPLKYVSLRKDGYQETIGTLPRSNGDRSIHFAAHEITEEIKSVPSGADVLTGTSKETLAKVGVTPYVNTLKALVPEDDFGYQFSGKSVAVWKPGYARAYTEWPASREDRTFNCQLREILIAYLRLHADAGGVRILVDGEFYGEIESPDKPLSLKVEANKTHTIQAVKETYRSASIEVLLPPDGLKKHQFLVKDAASKKSEMSSSTLQQGVGSLMIAGPASFKAIIDDTDVMESLPDNRPRIPAGMHKIQIIGPEFNQTITVEIKDGEALPINLEKRFGIKW